MNSKISLCVYMILLLSACVFRTSNIDTSNTDSGIVKIRNNRYSEYTYTHKYQRNSIRALPLIIKIGTKDNNLDDFIQLEFKAYNKKTPINYEKIEMFNAKDYKWEWSVYKKHKKFEKNRNFIIESYNTLIDSKVDELIQFFEFQPIYVKFIGEVESFKHLDDKHVQSLIKTLKYAKNK